MTRPSLHAATRSGSPPDGREASNADSTVALDLERIAKLVAEGQIPLPTNLGGQDFERLAELIRKFARVRLLRLIARLIADEIRRQDDVKEDRHD